MLRRLTVLLTVFIGEVVLLFFVTPALSGVQDDLYLSLKSAGLREFVAGNYIAAEDYFSKVLEISRATRAGSRDLALDLADLAQVYLASRRLPDAQRLFEESLSIFKNVPKTEQHTSILQRNLATVFRLQGKDREAEQTLRQALINAEKWGGRNGLLYADVLDELGRIYSHKGKMRRAESMVRKSLRIRERYVGPEDPWIEVSLNSLASLLRLQGKTPQAEPLLKRALALTEKAMGPDHPDVASVMCNLCQLYKQMHRYKEAESCLRRALDIQLAKLPPQHPDLAQTIFELGEIMMIGGNFKEAESLLRQSLEIRRKILPPNHSDLALTLETYSRLMSELHRSDEAIKFAVEAKRIRTYLRFTSPASNPKPL